MTGTGTLPKSIGDTSGKYSQRGLWMLTLALIAIWSSGCPMHRQVAIRWQTAAQVRPKIPQLIPPAGDEPRDEIPNLEMEFPPVPRLASVPMVPARARWQTRRKYSPKNWHGRCRRSRLDALGWCSRQVRLQIQMKKFDVAIAGAGLIGSAIALELARAGLRVGLFDKNEPGQEASWASAGILSPAPENPAMIATVPLGLASMGLYPEFIADVEEMSGHETGYRRKGTLQALFSRDAREELNTVIALHHGLGLKAEAVSADEAREMEPALSEEMEAAILRPDEGSVDNRRLTNAVLEAVKRAGVEIFT